MSTEYRRDGESRGCAVRCSFPLGIHARIPPTRGCRFPGHSSRDFSLPARHDRERKGGMSTAGRSASSRDRLLSHFRPSSSAIQTEREQDLPPGGEGGGLSGVCGVPVSCIQHSARPLARPPQSTSTHAWVIPAPGSTNGPPGEKKRGGGIRPVHRRRYRGDRGRVTTGPARK